MDTQIVYVALIRTKAESEFNHKTKSFDSLLFVDVIANAAQTKEENTVSAVKFIFMYEKNSQNMSLISSIQLSIIVYSQINSFGKQYCKLHYLINHTLRFLAFGVFKKSKIILL